MNADKVASQIRFETDSVITRLVATHKTSMRRDSRVESPLFLKIVGGFRRALSEWRAPSFALISECISPRVAQPPTIFRKSGYRAAFARRLIGSPFLWLLSFGEAKESDLPPGNPRQNPAAS
jgi:hypothetical protein